MAFSQKIGHGLRLVMLDSDSFPTEETWKEELSRINLNYVGDKNLAKWVFKFRIKRAFG
jgi:hypothetical protein